MNSQLTAEKQPEPIFEIVLRDYRNSVTMTHGSWELANRLKNGSNIVAWEIRRWDVHLQRNVVIAQSKNYHTVTPVTAVMKFQNTPLPKSEIIDGLFVDFRPERTYIYFSDAAKPFDSCLKIYNGTHVSIEGNVTLDNYEGFMKAAVLAKRYMRPVV
jgi:hypothetical protein